MNILWVDDQKDLINSFGVLLSKLDAKIVSAYSGDKALELIQNNFYDLVICDLKMPPGEWGGLWLIEEVKKRNIKVPILVLSGEGTQTETIRALRMGAQDYVMKEVVDKELSLQVEKIISQTYAEVRKSVVVFFPLPIALSYKRFLNTEGNSTKLHRMIECFENCLKILCIIGITELKLQPQPNPLSNNLISSILKPSTGTWNQIRNEVSKQLTTNSIFYQINGAFEQKTITEIIQLRNDLAHGSELSEKISDEKIKMYEPLLERMLFRIWQRLNFTFIVVNGQKFDGKSFQTDCHLLSGDSTSLSAYIFPAKNPLITNEVYCLVNDNDKQNCWSLFPFVIAEQGNEPTTWQIFIYDSVKSTNPNSPTNSDDIQYLNVWSGQRNIIPTQKPCYNQLPDFLKQPPRQ